MSCLPNAGSLRIQQRLFTNPLFFCVFLKKTGTFTSIRSPRPCSIPCQTVPFFYLLHPPLVPFDFPLTLLAGERAQHGDFPPSGPPVAQPLSTCGPSFTISDGDLSLLSSFTTVNTNKFTDFWLSRLLGTRPWATSPLFSTVYYLFFEDVPVVASIPPTRDVEMALYVVSNTLFEKLLRSR